MDTQTQIQRLIELAIVQRSELKQLVAELPQLREHLNAEIERVFEETEPQLRIELEEFVAKQAQDRSDAISSEVQEKIKALAQTLQDSAQAKFSALMAERERNVELTKQAEAKIAEAASALPLQVKEIVAAELARFPRAGEIDQLRKEFAEPKGLNPRGKWNASETYNRLDLVSYNGDSYVSNTDGNREKPSRTSSAWTLNAARGMGGGGGGVTSLTDLVPVPANGELLIGNGSAFVNNTLTAGTGVTITNGPGTITIDASGAQEILTATVKNADSVTITKGQVVYLFGATGNMASVKLAYNTSDATSAKTFGVVASTSIAPNGTGTITCVGVLDGLMLGSFNDGDTVYLGATPGSLTATKPYAPNHLVYVGVVERANNGNGELYVKVQNGYELDEIHDVQITTPPPAGALLVRDNTLSLWKAARLTAGTNIAVTNADASVTVGLTGTVAVANGGTGVTSSTGTGSVVLSNSPTLVTPVLGTPQSGTLTSCTGLPISTGVSGLGSNVATFLATPSSTNLRSAVTDETGTGALVFANTPTLVTPVLGDATGTTVTLTGNATVADVRLGTSGPSAKASIAARAARQGLVFDGTAAADLTGTAVLGTSDFSASAVVSTASSAQQYIFIGAGSGGFGFRVNNYALEVAPYGAGSLGASTTSITSGKPAHVAYVRSGTTGTFYINGVAAGTVTDATNYSYAYGVNRFGAVSSGTANLAGSILAPAVYNRALTAAEVVSLYESGVPAGSDYNTASNTSVLTGANSDFSSAGNWVVSGGTTISGGKLNLSDLAVAYNGLAKLTKALRYKLTITIDSITAGSVQYYDGVNWNTIATTAGTYTVEFTCAGTYAAGLHLRTNGGNAVLDTALYYQLGLLLAPDAGQAGGGLTWYDTSGNAANITLPATGVTWNVPTSGKTATTLTVNGGALTVNNLGSSSAVLSGTQSSSSGYSYLELKNTGGTAQSWQFGVAGSAVSGLGQQLYAYDQTANAVRFSVSTSGNFLLKSDGTDSGNGKLQLATHTTSAGGIGFGTTSSLYTDGSSGYLALAPTSGTGGGYRLYNSSSTLRGQFAFSGADCYLDAPTGNLIIRTGTSGATTALTLDSSQNATFAGKATATQFVATAGASAAGSIWAATTAGFIVQAKTGTVQDFVITNPGATANVLEVPTGTIDAKFGGTIAVQGTAAKIYAGTGSPEGVVTASPGSLYLNVSGGNNTTLYVKQSGTGNTGWNAK